ncbi:MAG: hypothetical protein Q8O87_03760 [bacterium]|nr:hypothetical protein [bacterium]
MNGYHEKLGRILRVDKRFISEIEASLEQVTGKSDVMKNIVEENDRIVADRLGSLGLSKKVGASEAYDALISKVEADDLKIFELINISSLRVPEAAKVVVDFVKKLHSPKVGYFLKIDKAKEFLIAEPPKNILKALGYSRVEDMLAKEDILEVYSALRFLEDRKWQNEIFFKQYEALTPDDFEERPIVLRALHPKWAKAAEEFVAKKYHNVSHLKELGVIFVIPVFLGISGETMRLVSLLAHYLNEVTYYANLFRDFRDDGDGFAGKVISLLRGDVVENRLVGLGSENKRPRFLVVQRYLAKDDENDWRLFEPRINPEALHWERAEEDIMKINQVFPNFHNGLEFWNGLGWVGDYFHTSSGVEILVSFNLVDTVMALVKQKEMIKYLYHHQEAMWNKIFIEYFGEDRLLEMSRKHILMGWFQI